MGDSLLRTREFDEFPYSLPSTEAGFDLSYLVKVGMEPHSLIQIVAVESSILRVNLLTNNPKDNLNLFIYNSKNELIG